MPLPAHELTLTRASTSHLSAFGYDWSALGDNGFAAPFSWAA